MSPSINHHYSSSSVNSTDPKSLLRLLLYTLLCNLCSVLPASVCTPPHYFTAFVKEAYWNSYVALCRFAITGSSDNLIRMWSMEEVYRQAMEAAWGPRPHATPTDSAHSSHTAAVAEDGQEVSQGHSSVAHTHCLVPSILHTVPGT